METTHDPKCWEIKGEDQALDGTFLTQLDSKAIKQLTKEFVCEEESNEAGVTDRNGMASLGNDDEWPGPSQRERAGPALFYLERMDTTPQLRCFCQELELESDLTSSSIF